MFIMIFKRYFFFLIILFCSVGWEITAQEMPDEIREMFRIVPYDALVGVGSAKAESDGESIMLAEDRARGEIAMQMDTVIHDIKRTIDNISYDIAEARSHAYVINTNVFCYVKMRDGTWWCAVYTSGKEVVPQIYPSEEDIRYYAANLPSPANIRAVDVIPDWVFNIWRNQPEDMKYGLGAAKAGNDDAAIRLAKERARRSLIHSFDTKVISYYRDITRYPSNDPSSFTTWEESNLSITSKWDDISFETFTINIAKTIDGTWWVLMGCRIDR